MADANLAAQRIRAVGREMLRPSPEPDESVLRRRIRRGALVIVALGSLFLMLWRIEIPYPWPDEAATVAAVERTWSGLWYLLGGRDAPLVPFYVLAKLAHTALPSLSTLVAVRTMSALAATATVVCLYVLVARRQGVLAALLASGLLLSMPGFIRWGQDARPYALLMLMTIGTWLAWSTYRRPEDPHPGHLRSWGELIRKGWGYIVLLGGSAMMSLFALFQWPAQLAADLTQPGLRPGERLRRAVPSAMAMVIAAVVFSAPLWLAAVKGHGPSRSHPLTFSEAAGALNEVIMVSGHPWWLFALALAGVAIAVLPTRLHPLLGEYSSLARIATAWTVTPFILMLVVGLVRPNLVRARYLAPLLSPIAILATVSILLLARLAAHWVIGRRPAAATQQIFGSAVAVAVISAALVLQGFSVYDSQRLVRTELGHNKDLRAVLSALNDAAKANPSARIAISGGIGRALIHAAQPSLDGPDPLTHFSDTNRWVWPVANTESRTLRELGGAKSIVWADYVPRGTRSRRPTSAPPSLARLGFTVVSSQRFNEFWVSDLERP